VREGTCVCGHTISMHEQTPIDNSRYRRVLELCYCGCTIAEIDDGTDGPGLFISATKRE